MKKFPRKFQYPLMVSMVLPTMLLSMVAKNLPQGGMFFDACLTAVGQMLPSALLLLVVVAPTVRLFVTKVLLEPVSK